MFIHYSIKNMLNSRVATGAGDELTTEKIHNNMRDESLKIFKFTGLEVGAKAMEQAREYIERQKRSRYLTFTGMPQNS